MAGGRRGVGRRSGGGNGALLGLGRSASRRAGGRRAVGEVFGGSAGGRQAVGGGSPDGRRAVGRRAVGARVRSGGRRTVGVTPALVQRASPFGARPRWVGTAFASARSVLLLVCAAIARSRRNAGFRSRSQVSGERLGSPAIDEVGRYTWSAGRSAGWRAVCAAGRQPAGGPRAGVPHARSSRPRTDTRWAFGVPSAGERDPSNNKIGPRSGLARQRHQASPHGCGPCTQLARHTTKLAHACMVVAQLLPGHRIPWQVRRPVFRRLLVAGGREQALLRRLATDPMRAFWRKSGAVERLWRRAFVPRKITCKSACLEVEA